MQAGGSGWERVPAAAGGNQFSQAWRLGHRGGGHSVPRGGWQRSGGAWLKDRVSRSAHGGVFSTMILDVPYD